MKRDPAIILTASILAVAATITLAAAPATPPAPALVPELGRHAVPGRQAEPEAAAPGRGTPATYPSEPDVKLPLSTPADGKPQINGPRITSGTPGHIFLYRIPATGDAPLAFSADNLPDGLKLDPATGIITGSFKAATTVAVNVHVTGAKGKADKQIVFVGGDHKLSLTPPLGWNSWNAWGTSVTDARVRATADGFEKSGLAAHGFQYVNIDDGWEIRGAGDTRNPDGTIIVNNKFPDMKALGDYIHSKGLKFGVYSGPGPTTCGGYRASWEHEEQDAHSWASWGVDYIKYDWCSYDQVAPKVAAGSPGAIQGGRNYFTLATLKKPYQDLRQALDKQDRDIILSLCQYGWGNVWEWGAEAGINGNVWRATGDISTEDSWRSMIGIGFQQNGHEQFVGPGHWNDTDMLVVGMIGRSNTPHPNPMTHNEQMVHIGLWSLLAAPMLMGNDMARIDDFTTSLMSNDEVLAVNQDPLGKMGWRIASTNADGSTTGNVNNRVKQIWARPLWDGTYAVGLFNLDNDTATISIPLNDLAAGLKTTLSGPLPARDLWQLKNLPPITDTVSAEVPRHAMVLLKIGTPKPDADNVAALVKLYAPK